MKNILPIFLYIITRINYHKKIFRLLSSKSLLQPVLILIPQPFLSLSTHPSFKRSMPRVLLDSSAPPQRPNSVTVFDANMVIILAALLFALICALGLNSIVRCILRCSRHVIFETPEAATARLAATGLKKKTLRQIPVAVFGSEGAQIPEMATECPICLGEFADGEKVRVLPECYHGFHVRCIDMWFASHSSCPICRNLLVEQKVEIKG